MNRRTFMLAAAGAAAAQEAQQAPPILRITVTQVQVDVVVTGPDGKRVTGLEPNDFELLQDGEPQKLNYFAYVAELPSSERKPEVRESAPPGQAPILASQVRRVVALVVDDLALSFENLVRTREALRKYIDTGMHAGDMLSIIRTGGGVAILEQFTTDRRILHAAVDALKWRFSGRVGVGAIHPLEGGTGREPGDREYLDYGAPAAAFGALATLEQVVNGMKNMPGRKSVVFLSDALRMDREVTDAIDQLTDLANRAAVSIYTVDPSGLRTKSDEDLEPTGVLGGVIADTLGRALAPEQGLEYLARKTGGIHFFNSNDIPANIRRSADDQLGFYLPGYTPAEGTFEDGKDTAKFHRLIVNVKRPGLKVRWKSGFLGVPDQLQISDDRPKSREQQLVDALVSPFTATGIQVRLTALYLDFPPHGARVHTMLHFSAKDLKFVSDQDKGSWSADVDLVTSAYRGLRQPLQQWQRRLPLRLTDDVFKKAQAEGFLFNVDYPVKEPGMFLIRAVVRDAASERIGSASQVVTIPDTRKNRLAVSGIWLRTATAELKKAAGVMDRADGVSTEAWSEGGPATRRYRGGHDVLYSFFVVNLKTKGNPKAPSATSQVNLFREGKIAFEGQPIPIRTDGRMDASHYVGGGVIRLGKKMMPGEYLMQVIVTDSLAGKKRNRVATWIDFEVV